MTIYKKNMAVCSWLNGKFYLLSVMYIKIGGTDGTFKYRVFKSV